jgi:hypothetical protein
MLKKIEALVQSQGHCALATCPAPDADAPSDGPHVSLMAYCAAPDLREFWLATLAGTQKYRNLLANPRASLLIDDRTRCAGAPGQALTVAVLLLPFATAGAEAAARRELLAKHQNLRDFLDKDGAQMLRFVVQSFQLLTGLTEVFVLEMEKKLDGSGRVA